MDGHLVKCGFKTICDILIMWATQFFIINNKPTFSEFSCQASKKNHVMEEFIINLTLLLFHLLQNAEPHPNL